MATHSSVLICSYLKIPQRILLGQVPGVTESDMADQLRPFSSSMATKIEQVNMDSKRQENQEKSGA